MNTNHFRSAHHIAISCALALSIHVVTAVAFYYVTSDEDKNTRTVPVVLISHQSTITKPPTHQSNESSSRAAQISTNARSERLTSHKNDKKANEESTNDSNAPRIPALIQPLRQQRKRDGLTDLFSQNPGSKLSNQIKQVSTKDTITLSEYQQRLIIHMLQGKLYDKFHRILDSNNTKQLDYTLKLWLLPSGAIKNASIKISSGIEEIDKLAITAAYNASPYPKPPQSDAATRFQYEVPVQYQP